MSESLSRPCRLGLISLTTQDAQALASFYESAFGFRRIGAARREGPEFEALMKVRGGAKRILLELGAERIELLEFDEAGAVYPRHEPSSSLVFQHFAIVVSDMNEAYRGLAKTSGWAPVSRGGPVVLPPSSGGVAAFKFRDPDGHPLEFLAFPQDETPAFWRNKRAAAPCLGIDHSAISVSDTARSIAFYESLGFQVNGQSLNHGEAQARLDGLQHSEVEVTALRAGSQAPHLELLCYRSSSNVELAPYPHNDVATTRLILEARDKTAATAAIVDPDGHHIIIKPA